MASPFCENCGKEMHVRTKDMPYSDTGKTTWWECPHCHHTPTCEECGEPTLLRRATRGKNAGGYFWGCSTFPKCRSTTPYANPSDEWEQKRPSDGVSVGQLTRMLCEKMDEPLNWNHGESELVLNLNHMTQWARQTFVNGDLQRADISLTEHFAVDCAIFQQADKIVFDPYPGNPRVLVLKDRYGNRGLQMRARKPKKKLIAPEMSDSQIINKLVETSNAIERKKHQMAKPPDCYSHHLPDAQKCIVCPWELDCSHNMRPMLLCASGRCTNKVQWDDAVVDVETGERHVYCDVHLGEAESVGRKFVRERHMPHDIRGTCSQCGKAFEESACGPTHAAVHAERAKFVAQASGSPQWIASQERSRAQEKLQQYNAADAAMAMSQRIEQAPLRSIIEHRPTTFSVTLECGHRAYIPESYREGGFSNLTAFGCIDCANGDVPPHMRTGEKINEQGGFSHFPLPDTFHPRYCRKCGKSSGCMCPRDEVPPKKLACEHKRLVRVDEAIVREMKFEIKRAEETQLYACKDCQQVFAVRGLKKKR